MRIAELCAQKDWNHKFLKVLIKRYKDSYTFYKGPYKKLTDMQLQTRVAYYELYADGHCLTIWVDAFPEGGHKK